MNYLVQSRLGFRIETVIAGLKQPAFCGRVEISLAALRVGASLTAVNDYIGEEERMNAPKWGSVHGRG
jgi:hypothetical protein